MKRLYFNRIFIIVFSFFIVNLSFSRVCAQKSTLYQVGIGHANILDTYLSPQNYTGTDFRFVSTTTRHKGKWTNMLQHEAYFSSVENMANTADEMAGMYRFRYGLLKDMSFKVKNLAVRVGGQAALNVGFLYNTRNENNPAQGRLGLHIGPTAQADYDFKLWKKTFTLRYDACVPLAGLMFSPNYGQSYYEIFTKGNYDNNCVPTTIFATPSLRQSLAIEFKIGKQTLSVGYLGDYDQYKVNNLKYHNYTHAVVLGIRR